MAGCGNSIFIFIFLAVERCDPAPTETLTRPHERHGSGNLVGLFGVHGFIDGVSVAPQKLRGRVKGKGLSDLRGGPLSRGMGGHVEGNDVTPIVPQDEEAEQDGERDRVDGEEVEGGNRVDGVPEERPPPPTQKTGLRGRLGAAWRASWRV